MSIHPLALDEKHFRAAAENAAAAGKTPEEYVAGLIEADSQSFDEILQDVREGFGAMSDGEVDDLFERAKKEARGQSK